MIWHRFPTNPIGAVLLMQGAHCHEGDFTQATTYFQQLAIKRSKVRQHPLQSDAREIRVCSQQCISYGGGVSSKSSRGSVLRRSHTSQLNTVVTLKLNSIHTAANSIATSQNILISFRNTLLLNMCIMCLLGLFCSIPHRRNGLFKNVIHLLT